MKITKCTICKKYISSSKRRAHMDKCIDQEDEDKYRYPLLNDDRNVDIQNFHSNYDTYIESESTDKCLGSFTPQSSFGSHYFEEEHLDLNDNYDIESTQNSEGSSRSSFSESESDIDVDQSFENYDFNEFYSTFTSIETEGDTEPNNNNNLPLKFEIFNNNNKMDLNLKKSMELYNIVQEENVTRETHEKLVNFFNNWILNEGFGK